MKKLLFILIIITGAIASFVYRDSISSFLFRPTQSAETPGISHVVEGKDIEVIADELRIPWDIAFLPDGSLLVTERPGLLRRIDGETKKSILVGGVEHVGEGGLLGVALHPNFRQNQLVYLYFTTEGVDGLANRVERYRLEDDRLNNLEVIISDIPGAVYHDGGKIAFGPDGKLYITTGDAGDEDSAQALNSVAGKILRLNDDGSIPSDNPFGTAVYSYGHRNSQGIAWDIQGNLWSTEHGRSGVRSGLDELNLIEPGNNYGWPVIQGDETLDGMQKPNAHSGPDVTWAPGGIAYLDGSLFFSGLRGESLYQVILDGTNIVDIKAHFREEYGRLRAVQVGPDGYLYITTSNTDGRGTPQEGDDKIIKIDPEIFGL